MVMQRTWTFSKLFLVWFMFWINLTYCIKLTPSPKHVTSLYYWPILSTKTCACAILLADICSFKYSCIIPKVVTVQTTCKPQEQHSLNLSQVPFTKYPRHQIRIARPPQSKPSCLNLNSPGANFRWTLPLIQPGGAEGPWKLVKMKDLDVGVCFSPGWWRGWQ